MGRDMLFIVGALVGAYVVNRQNRRQLAASRSLAARNINDNVASAEQNTNYWARHATGARPTTQTGQSDTGVVTPANTLTRGGSPLVIYGGQRAAWSMPRAGVVAGQYQSPRPLGRVILPGPVTPGAPSPQSPVASTSPFITPKSLTMDAPMPIAHWFQNMNPSSAFAMQVGSNWADVVRTMPVTGQPLTVTEKA